MFAKHKHLYILVSTKKLYRLFFFWILTIFTPFQVLANSSLPPAKGIPYIEGAKNIKPGPTLTEQRKAFLAPKLAVYQTFLNHYPMSLLFSDTLGQERALAAAWHSDIKNLNTHILSTNLNALAPTTDNQYYKFDSTPLPYDQGCLVNVGTMQQSGLFSVAEASISQQLGFSVYPYFLLHELGHCVLLMQPYAFLQFPPEAKTIYANSKLRFIANILKNRALHESFADVFSVHTFYAWKLPIFYPTHYQAKRSRETQWNEKTMIYLDGLFEQRKQTNSPEYNVYDALNHWQHLWFMSIYLKKEKDFQQMDPCKIAYASVYQISFDKLIDPSFSPCFFSQKALNKS